jgi:hypothetical protein
MGKSELQGCPLCASIQEAVEGERRAAELLLEAADEVGFRVFPEGDGADGDWLEYACRRDEYERARTRRVRTDNRFFDCCPRCHFDLKAARRELEFRRNELPWYRHIMMPEPRVRATGS